MNLTLPEFLVFLVQYCMRYKHDFARSLPLADRLQRFMTHHVCRIDTLSVGFTALGIAGYNDIAALVEGHRLVEEKFGKCFGYLARCEENFGI